MIYLSRDKRRSDRNPWGLRATGIFIFLLILILLFPAAFGNLIFAIGRPFWQISNSISQSFLFSSFSSKSKLIEENRKLSDEVNRFQSAELSRQSLVQENNDLKNILGRKPENAKLTLATILVRPPESPYDTFIVDVGTETGVKIGETALAFGNIAVGKVIEVRNNSSIVKLFSSSGEKNQVLIRRATSTIAAAALGEGGGNFQITLPVGTVVEKGDQVVLSDGRATYLGTIESIDIPQNGSFETIFLKSPVDARALLNLQILGN